MPQDILTRVDTNDFTEAHARCVQIGENELLRRTSLGHGAARMIEMDARTLEQRRMSDVRDSRGIAQLLITGERVNNRAAQLADAGAVRR